MTIYCYVTTMHGQCGGMLIHHFTSSDYFSDKSTLLQIRREYRGYMLIATFNQNQKNAYLACCKTFTLLGQSSPIKNPNTNSYIFTAIFKA